MQDLILLLANYIEKFS